MNGRLAKETRAKFDSESRCKSWVELYSGLGR
jgi:hypothetical protein